MLQRLHEKVKGKIQCIAAYFSTVLPPSQVIESTKFP